MQPTLNIALRAARIAGEQIVRAIERLDIIKSEQQDVHEFLIDAAVSAEKTAAYNIHKANPQHRVNGRHGGPIKGQDEEGNIEWLVDPIDGIANFRHGLPNFALTLVCQQKGRAEHVVVLNPVTGEEFTASRGRGAQLNGKRIRVSPAKSLKDTLIASNFLSQQGERPELQSQLEMLKHISLNNARQQDIGSPALALAYLAAGRYDGAIMQGLDRWQLDPGMLLIQESGGLMGDLKGGTQIQQSGDLAAGNPKLFKQLLQVIHPALR
ncbi:inositol monophosphatase family protein [Motiliproteus sp. SC1-56]|uniref:inositol monophosphatase family protein n=1 Tax=Motiliproteus sp. SC1-56 TaxID=2799565 RepID=UPI001A90C0BF|nr:inositol monophosphatase family protein [Motiliproteus sp. SC1-56]